MRRRQARTSHEILAYVAIEPVLTRLEARDDRMTRRAVVRRRVFTQRLIAAADVPAFRASAQMKPPAVFGEALDATRARRWDLAFDAVGSFAHDFTPLSLDCDHAERLVELAGKRRNRRTTARVRENFAIFLTRIAAINDPGSDPRLGAVARARERHSAL